MKDKCNSEIKSYFDNLSNFQGDFLKGHRGQIFFLYLTEKMRKIRESMAVLATILVDLSKIFNCISRFGPLPFTIYVCNLIILRVMFSL